MAVSYLTADKEYRKLENEKNTYRFELVVCVDGAKVKLPILSVQSAEKITEKGTDTEETPEIAEETPVRSEEGADKENDTKPEGTAKAEDSTKTTDDATAEKDSKTEANTEAEAVSGSKVTGTNSAEEPQDTASIFASSVNMMKPVIILFLVAICFVAYKCVRNDKGER